MLFTNIFIITIKYNTTFIPFLLIRYIFKRWGILCTYHKNHVDFKYVYLQKHL